jgi:hypothetical protein
MTTPWIARAGGLTLALAAALAGCATTQMTAQWRDPGFDAGTLRRGQVLVVCRVPDEALRRLCEDQWAALLGARGLAPLRSYSILGFPWASGDDSPEMTAAVAASGAKAFTSMSIAPGGTTVVNPAPQVGVGVSGGGYRGGGFSVGGIGISFPIGSPTATHSLSASSALVDAASGRLVWSGSASTPASADTTAQVGALAQVTFEAMRAAGLF